MVDHIDDQRGIAMAWPDSLLPDGVDPETATLGDYRSAEYFLMLAVAEGLERLAERSA
jgi:hypothetical protein